MAKWSARTLTERLLISVASSRRESLRPDFRWEVFPFILLFIPNLTSQLAVWHCQMDDAAIAGCLTAILVPALGDFPGIPDPAGALLGLTGWNLTRSDALTQAQQLYTRGELTSCLRFSLDHLQRRPWSREATLLAARCLSRLDFATAAEPYYKRRRRLDLNDSQIRAVRSGAR